MKNSQSLKYKKPISVTNPKIAKEWHPTKNIKSPKEVTRGSHYKAVWICPKKHEYFANVNARISGNTNCSICAGKKVGYGNDLQTLFPEIAKEWHPTKNIKSPKEVTTGSKYKATWVCPKGCIYETSVYVRTKKKNYINNCPFCDGKRVGYGNDLQTLFPEIAKEWHPTKNKLKASEVHHGSRKKHWWKCSKGCVYDTTPSSRTARLSGCPYCAGQKVGYGNDLKTLFPEIAKEWHPTKNKLKASEVTPNSINIVWWQCPKGCIYDAKPNSRISSKSNCPYCSGKRVGYGNDLQTLFPEIAKEWHPTKNKLKANEVTPAAAGKYYWLCPKKHTYYSLITNRTHITRPGRKTTAGCPYCSGQKVGYGNDLQTLFPEIAKEWHPTKNKLKASEVTPGTQKKYWWKCNVGHKDYLQGVVERTRQGQGCPFCVLTPRSKEEIYLLFELKYFFNINENEHKLKLKKVEDVDIIINNIKIIVEYDGFYWHKDKLKRDIQKTKLLQNAGWTVIRVREKPLKIISKKFNVSTKSRDYKTTSNKVIKKISQLGHNVENLDSYIKRKTLINKKMADEFIKSELEKKN